MTARGTAKVPGDKPMGWDDKAPDDISEMQDCETTAVKAVAGIRIFIRDRIVSERASGKPNSGVIDALLEIYNRVKGL